MEEQKLPENIVPGTEPKPQVNLVQKNIRTYESDIADALSKKKTSVAQIAIAESERNTGREGASTIVEEKSGMIKKILLFIISIALISAGIYGGYYLYKKSPFSAPAPIQVITVPKNVVPTDKQIILNNETAKTTGPLFLGKIEGDVPDILIRSITDKWMLGSFVEEGGEKSIFIALTTDFFQNAYAGMLQWEDYMSDDLSTVLNFSRNSANNGHFEDRQIKNRDVREFYGNSNETLFLYSFIDKNTLIITTTENALSAIINRVENQTYVR